MGRIRSIKPEFPQSESIGRLTREARLLFIQLWTIVDDEGRARGASRMLASLLYPYDPDAPMLIGGWLDELERECHIRRYTVENSTYLEVINFNEHQKIDHPSKSKLPQFANPRESSRILAPDQGGDQDQGRDQGGARAAREEPPLKPAPPAPKSPGAEGEFMAVTWLCEELRVVLAPRQREMTAKQVLFTAQEIGRDAMEAAEHIRGEATAARARGEPIDAWYLADGKWRAQGGADGANRRSATHQRVSANKRALAEALARRGIDASRGTALADGG